MKFVRLLPFLFIVLDACIDPLPVQFYNTDSSLVVDGMITQEPGPYEVRLYYSATSSDTRLPRVYETGAHVWISDDLGNTEVLTETKTGIYKTSASGMQGEIGRSYSIHIITKNDKEYVSAPQLMKDPGEVSGIVHEYEKDAINSSNSAAPQDVFNIYVNGKATTSESNLFRWRWTGVYEVTTAPELHDTLYPRARNPTPDPRPCSGYILQGGGLFRVGECTCCVCWSYTYSESSVVSDNRFSSQNTFNKVNLGRIPITNVHFDKHYHVMVEQLSLSEEAYRFWTLVKAQQDAQGSIFQPTAVRIKGNITSTTDPDEIVLGFFNVSAISRRGIFIEPEDIPYQLTEPPLIGDDCRKVYANSTTTRPDFW